MLAASGCGGGGGPAGDAPEPDGLRTDARALVGRAGERTRILVREAEQALVLDAERTITADARRRARRGEFEGPILGTRCEEEQGEQDEYGCIASEIRPRPRPGPAGVLIGQRYLVRLDVAAGRFAYCFVVPPAGEGAGAGPAEQDPVPEACGG